MKTMKVRLVFTEAVLGTLPANDKVYSDFIASKAPDASTITEEIAAIGVDKVDEKGMTMFPKLEDGTPFFYDYQIKGFFKGCAGFLRTIPGKESSKIKAYKKKIDGHIFINERKIPIEVNGAIDICQRPLRAQTMQGERVSLASSEQIPAGSAIEFTITMLDENDEPLVREWLNYGKLSGIGQWRNSGKGRFVWEEDVTDNIPN